MSKARQARGKRVFAKQVDRDRVEPGSQYGLFEIPDTVQAGCYSVARLDHLARDFRMARLIGEEEWAHAEGGDVHQ